MMKKKCCFKKNIYRKKEISLQVIPTALYELSLLILERDVFVIILVSVLVGQFFALISKIITAQLRQA